VVAFYNNGGGNDANKDKAIKPLGMSAGDQADLVAYLESLSGDPLTSAEHVWKDKIPANYTAIADWLNTPN
ncbi:MAG: photosynthetic protein synthase I, partial [Rhodospirillales bacterium]|nr:photosynthetic protein synthase I [Rhodospirillales bacterium]